MGLLEAVHEAEIDMFRAMNLAGTNVALDSVMVFFTIMGTSYIIVLICVPLWIQGKKDAAFDVVMLVILATIATEALKLVVDRPRPDLELSDIETIVSASGSAFPSGHSARAFAVACLLYMEEPRKYGVTALIIASLIAVSRVYLGVHWPTDVLAGAVLGVVAALVLTEFAKRSVRYQSVRKMTVATLSRG